MLCPCRLVLCRVHRTEAFGRYGCYICHVYRSGTPGFHVGRSRFWIFGSRNGRIVAENAISRTSEPIFHISAIPLCDGDPPETRKRRSLSEITPRANGTIHLRSDFKKISVFWFWSRPCEILEEPITEAARSIHQVLGQHSQGLLDPFYPRCARRKTCSF